MGKELHVTLQNRHPHLLGLYTAALSDDFLESNALKYDTTAWVKELAGVLGATITISPSIKNAPLGWETRNYTAAPVSRLVHLPTDRNRAAFCVDGRLADVAFANRQGRLMDVVRIPGPDPDLVPTDDDMVLVQHGHCDPIEYGVEGEKSWDGCGWRTARVTSLKVAGWDYFLLHTPEGKITALRENTEK